MKNPDELSAGLVITIPGISESAAPEGKEKSAETSTEPASEQKRFIKYTVREGDNLTKIAEKFLDDGNAYDEIIEANEGRLDDPDTIYPGDVILVPVRNK